MSKKSFKILLVLVTVLSLISSYSFATDDEKLEEPVAVDAGETLTTGVDGEEVPVEGAIPEDGSSEAADSESASTNHDVYITEDEVKIEADETINGNAFIIGKTVTITGQIGGDLFVLADTLNLDGGQVYGNIFVCADTVTLNGLVYDLYGICKTLTISYDCVAYRDIKAVCDEASINGVIGKDVNLTAGKSFNLEDDCVIYGNLNYYAPNKVEVKEDLVKGENNYMGLSMFPNVSSIINDLKASSQNKSVGDYVIAALVTLVFALVVWFAMVKFAPKFHEKLNNVSVKQMLWAILVGFIALIVVPIVSVLLMFTVVGVTVGLLLLTLYFVALSLAPVVIAIALAKPLANGVPALSKFNNIFAVILVTIALWAIGLIPYAGPVVQIVAMLCGFGLLLKLLVNKKEKAEEPAKDDKAE